MTSGNKNEESIPSGLAGLYQDPVVRDRIADYLGRDRDGRPTANYLTRCDGIEPAKFKEIAIENWENALRKPWDLARSLGDRDSLIAHIDIEYVDFDFPAEAFVDPERACRLQEPVVKAIEEILASFGIRPLHLLTGQGHHFVWRMANESISSKRLRGEVCPGALVASGDDVVAVPGSDEAGFEGLGLVMEYLAQEVRKRVASVAEIPVELTTVEVGKLISGRREIVSIDLSEYGDPLASRVIRLPFTHYRKPWQSGLLERLGLLQDVPRFVTLPLHEIDVQQAIKIRQNAAEVRDLAHRTLVRIPDQGQGMGRLIDAYLSSSLRGFHRRFYEVSHDPRGAWPETYAKTPTANFFPCVRTILEEPNDLLLKPVALQLLTRYLLVAGWHPRHIAGLVRSRFEEPSYGWRKGYWDVYNSGLRADFYVRSFVAELETGIDEAVDFNCVSTQDKHLCSCPDCPQDLSRLRGQLLENVHG